MVQRLLVCMPRRRALLLAVPATDLDIRPAVQALRLRLPGWGFAAEDTLWCTGREATRVAILDRLQRFVAATEPGEHCLIYYFGHGGFVYRQTTGQDGRELYYLAVHRDGDDGFTGLLDIELGAAVADLSARGATVSVILDCCHAAGMHKGVRSRPRLPSIAAPDWVDELERRAPSLAAEAHPDIVYLAASSSLRQAYAHAHVLADGRDGHIGLLTQSLCEILDDLGAELHQVTWAALGLRLREAVFARQGSEDQFVVLAGPIDRYLFSRQKAEAVPQLAWVPGRDRAHGEGRRDGGVPNGGSHGGALHGGALPGGALPGGGLRGGALHGVEVGDRFALIELVHEPERAPRQLALARAQTVELTRTQLRWLEPPKVRPPPGTGVRWVATKNPLRVWLMGRACEAQRRVLADSSELMLVDSDAGQGEAADGLSVSTEGATVRIDASPDAQPHTLELPGEATAQALQLRTVLEDIARGRRLLRCLAGLGERLPAALTLRWGRYQGELRKPLAQTGGRLLRHDRLWFELEHAHSHLPYSWYVTLLLRDPLGRLTLLNTREPTGLELVPGQQRGIGRSEPGRARGLGLAWPTDLLLEPLSPSNERHGDERARVTLIALASRAPLELTHLDRRSGRSSRSAWAMQGLCQPPAMFRGRGPKAASAHDDEWGLWRFSAVLTT